jgi:hypothetical protein
MRVTLVTLSLCVISACTIVDGEGEQSVTQDVRPTPDFVAQMDVANGCGDLHIFSSWSQPQTGTIDYTITDATSGNGFIYTAVVSPLNNLDNNHLFGVLQPVTGREHRFTLDAQLKDSSGVLVYEDTYRTRFPCSF